MEVHEGEGVPYKEKNVVRFCFDCIFTLTRGVMQGGGGAHLDEKDVL